MNESVRGPQPRFQEKHLWKALKVIHRKEFLGRKQISQKLDIGEGSTRTVLNRLKEKKLIKSTPRGHSLTEKGLEEIEKRLEKFSHLDAGSLTVGEKDAAVLVKGADDEIDQGIEQRDEAIKAGADGATVLVFKDSKFKTSEVEMEVPPKLRKELLDAFKPDEGDVIIIGTAGEETDAELGALAAAESI